MRGCPGTFAISLTDESAAGTNRAITISASSSSRYHQGDDEPDRPIRNLEKQKDLRCDLDQQRRHDGVGDGGLIDIAPLQLGKEIASIHGADP